MDRKAVLAITLTLMLTSMLTFAFNIQLAKSDWTWAETIYIKVDGSVDPPTAPISSVDNITYTLTENIVGDVPIETSAIVVERDNVVVDGAGYTVKGTGTDFSKGIDLTYRSNVTIKNIKIRDFYYGIYLHHSSNNCISENEMTPNNVYGIRLYSHCNNNTISGNNASDNVIGIFLRSYCNNNTVSSNDVHSNLDFGVYLDGSSNNTISENNITNNGWGIILGRSSNNTVSGNKITANIGGIEVSSSSDNAINGNNITNNEDGIMLASSSNITISGNNITANNDSGIMLGGSSNCNIVCGNNITNNGAGIYLSISNNNTIDQNIITNNWYGIYLLLSSNNTVNENTMTNNYRGFCSSDSGGNTLRYNSMASNVYNFDVNGDELFHFVNDVDTSNTVDGKTVYYFINEKDLTINPSTFPDVGYLASVNSTCITIQNLNLTNNGDGILFAYTNNSMIKNVDTMNNWYGIYLLASTGNTFSGNKAIENVYGIELSSSDNNLFVGNTVTNNSDGIFLWRADNNTFTRNIVINSNYRGIYLSASSNNVIYNNNFINNTNQVFVQEEGTISANTWDDGYPSGGNYWSDYAGVDLYGSPHQNETGSDGIGDTPYFIDEDNQDNYPLMGMFYDFSLWYGMTAICNSTIYDFHAGYIITKEGLKSSIDFNVVGPSDTTGFCRIIIPRDFMEGPYTVLVHNEEVDATELPISNSTHAFLYFNYPNFAHIKITEFPPTPPVVKTTVDVDPDALNLKSKGKWISAHIELPEDYDVRGIDRTTVTLNDTIPVDPFWVDKPLESVIGDYDNDGITDLMVKFDRQALIEYIRTEGITEAEVTLSITGKANGKSFEATDTIKVIGQ